MLTSGDQASVGNESGRAAIWSLKMACDANRPNGDGNERRRRDSRVRRHVTLMAPKGHK
ncbi:hypothetical protein HanIR_Chr14g0672431 [Helianthus annuus]|nr:hypothetical protein HanIR_Chr14g0672431 [Helianthus annuus]